MRIGMNLMLWTAVSSYAEHARCVETLAELGYGAFEIPVYGLSAGLRCVRRIIQIPTWTQRISCPIPKPTS